MSDIIYLTNVRLSFPKLVEAATQANFPNSPKKYSTDLIIPSDDPNFARFMNEVSKAASEKWKDQAQAVLQMIQNDRRLRCYGSGAEKIDSKTMQPWAGYAGMAYITTSADEGHPPTMIREDGSTIDNANILERSTAARKMYGGCYVNAAVRPWVQDNQFGRAIRCQLIAVQFSRDGQAFGEAPPDLNGKFAPVQPQSEQPGTPVPASAGVPSWMPRV